MIVNELINQMGQLVLRNLLSEANCSMWFSILADEATDVSHNYGKPKGTILSNTIFSWSKFYYCMGKIICAWAKSF